MGEPNSAAERIGAKLTDAMSAKGLNASRLAELMDKDAKHVEAVLAGYPNSTTRPTQLDTVDEIARALGCRLDVIAIETEAD
jgi:hypothetical protein